MYEYLKKLSKLEDFDIQLEDNYRHKDFKSSGNWRSKWTKFSQSKKEDFDGRYIVHRKCLNKEIILDLDNPDILMNKWALYYILRAFDKQNIKYRVFFSGGKGFHVSTFWNWHIKYLKNEPEKVVKITYSKRLSIIRRAILDKILKTEGEYCYNYFAPDIDWQMIDVHRKLIRAEGSEHQKGGIKSILPIYTAEDVWEYDEDSYKLGLMPDNVLINEINLGCIYTEYLKELETDNDFKGTLKNPDKMRWIIKKVLNMRLSDGKKQALYIIHNELKRLKMSRTEILDILNTWNSKQEEPLDKKYILSQLGNKHIYRMSNKYIEESIEKQFVIDEVTS